MAGNILDLAKPFKPLVFDPGTNEWILKERDTPGVCDVNKDCFVPSQTETEYLGVDGQMYYKRVEHHRTPYFKADVVAELTTIKASRIPGPTNGGLDLDPRTRWMITGSPLPIFRTKDDTQLPLAVRLQRFAKDLELRLRLILARAIPMVGPQIGKDIIEMLKDPITIALFVAGVISFVAIHLSAGSGIGAIVALVMDCITAALVGFTLGRNAIPFLEATWDFMFLLVDAQTEDEIDEAAGFLAKMISILAVTAITIALTIIMKRLFNAFKAKAPNGPVKEPPPAKKPFFMDPKKPIGPQVALGEFVNSALIKVKKVIDAAREAFAKSKLKNDPFFRKEHGFFIVEEADGAIGVEPWPDTGAVDNITPPNMEIRPGKGFFFKNKKVRGTVHTHPVFPEDPLAFGENAGHTGPSLGDGNVASEIQASALKNKIGEMEHYVVAGDNVFIFDHNKRFATVGSRIKLIGR